jgi:hypothetical protein
VVPAPSGPVEACNGGCIPRGLPPLSAFSLASEPVKVPVVPLRARRSKSSSSLAAYAGDVLCVDMPSILRQFLCVRLEIDGMETLRGLTITVLVILLPTLILSLLLPLSGCDVVESCC